jgi:lipopolysaccharide biosynthesis protein
MSPDTSAGSPIRPLAFYLPQYHPTPENDAWWGKGFTEWTNVARAKPLFRGHYQPHLPADLGFYDLRVPEVRQQQAELARQHGLYGFCYYHYWFNGRRLLERPFNEVLDSGQPDFPFCLCWANESWTRTWDGGAEQFLIKQEHSDQDDRRHVQWLIEKVFSDPRYIRINNKPVFLVYRASELPNPARTVDLWRTVAQQSNLELYLCRVESFLNERDDPKTIGFDAAVEFQPDWALIGPPLRRTRRWRWLAALGISAVYGKHRIYDYVAVSQRMIRKRPAAYVRFPCVMPAWDNSARRRTDAVIFANASPDAYERWLTETVRRFQPPTPEENLLFINAWNEWGEGNHLEPCQQWGHSYLQATHRALTSR